jgi:hypothetical protein
MSMIDRMCAAQPQENPDSATELGRGHSPGEEIILFHAPWLLGEREAKSVYARRMGS